MKATVLLGFTALAVAAAMTATVPALRASASAARPVTGAQRAASSPATRPDVSSTAASSWQTNSTVWALAVAQGVVYVGGQFTSVRPPGDPAGTEEVARTYLAAFNASTGALVTSFAPEITGTSAAEITALAVSPDGTTLYVGGLFDHVNGSFRDNLAAFSIPTGALTSWAPPAFGQVLKITPSPGGSEIYLGGDFKELDGQARTFAGAVDASGSLLPWAPSIDKPVTSIAVSPDDSRALVGGYFQTVNGVAQNAIESTNPVTGGNEPWAAAIVPFNPPSCTSAVKDIIISGSTAYISAEGTGAGCYDGDFAAKVSSGALVWQNDCLGATQALVIINGWLFKGSHAHDCAYAPGGFPQAENASGIGVVTRRLLDQSLADGTLGHWTPNVNGNPLGPRAMATDGSQLFLGGDFTSVNGRPQQGFARFGPGPDGTRPGPPAAPTVASTSAGVDSVTFTAVSTSDVGTLTYKIYRDRRKTSVGTVIATSWPWALPVLHYRDAGLRPGSRHTYRVTVSDGTRTSAKSSASARITVSSRSPSHSYRRTVLRGKPSFFWRLDQARGRIAADSSPHGFKGIYRPGTTLGVSGPIKGSADTATRFNGVSGNVSSARKSAAPRRFSIEGWFKTTTNTGGRLIGFGSRRTGASSKYDRQIYMMNDGQVVFGVQSQQNETIESPRVYNNGQWHYVVATLSPTAGMSLYIDGQRVGTNPTTSAEAYDGYWRVGGDNLNGWNLDPRRNSQAITEPNSYYFRGSIGDVAVYPRALSKAAIAAHYAANALSH